MRILVFPFTAIILVLAACTSPVKGDDTAQSVTAAFKNINSFEGNVSLIFNDGKRDIWLSHFEVDISKFGFYLVRHREGAVLPEFMVNQQMIGRRFRIRYRIEKREGDFSGEMQDVYVVTGMEQM